MSKKEDKDTAFMQYIAIKTEQQKKQEEMEAVMDAQPEEDGIPVYRGKPITVRLDNMPSDEDKINMSYIPNKIKISEKMRGTPLSPPTATCHSTSHADEWIRIPKDQKYFKVKRTIDGDGFGLSPPAAGHGTGLDTWESRGYVEGNDLGQARAFPARAKGYSTPKYRGTALMEPSDKVVMEDVTEIMPELRDKDAKIPQDVEMFDLTRNSLKIIRTPDTTMIYAYVVDKKGEENKFVGIPCRGGVAYGGYAYDRVADACLVECVQNVDLGSLPFSFKLQMPKCGTWCVECPIPEKVLEKSFTPPQRKKLNELREKFPTERYEIHYLQMLKA